MNTEQLLLDLADRIHNRFYGKYRGTVTGVDDFTLRIKAKVPAVLGDQESGWAMPCVPYAGPSVGMAFLPEVGAGVWIEFEAGDVSFPIWVGCYWRSNEIPADAKPTVKTIVTKGGNKLLLDDDQTTVTLTDANKNSTALTKDGITLSRGQQKLVVGSGKTSINGSAFEVQ